MRAKRYRLKNYIAEDLLHTFIELRYRVPDLTKWKYENFSQKDSLGFRYNKLVALFRALEIPWDPEGFVAGRFIDLKSSRYDTVIEKMRAEAQGLRLGHVSHKFTKDRHFKKCFQLLLGYRQSFESLFNINRGILTAPVTLVYGHAKASHFNRIIKDKIGCIENILLSFINPEEKNFSYEQLKTKYGYPDSSLYTDELDEW